MGCRGRIKELCWDPMGVQGAALKGLKSILEVHNFPLPKESSMASLLPKIKLLQQVELKEQKHMGLESQGSVLWTDGQEDGNQQSANGKFISLVTVSFL